MDATTWSVRLFWIALVALAVGAVDPLEGSLVIFPASLVLAFAAVVGHLRARRELAWAAGLITLGVAALWGMSAVGGLGGNTGRSLWWALVLLPYPVGWLMALHGALRSLRGGTGSRSPAPRES